MFYGIYFLSFTIFLYLLLFLKWPEKAQLSTKTSLNLLLHIIPVLLLVTLVMALINYYAHPETIKKYIGKGSGIKGWLLAVSMGILSHGPIYAWYPFLKDLRNSGMRNGLIAVFLYNRAIKIPLLPLMLYYFGVKYVVVLITYMIAASIVEGKIIEMIES